MPRLRHGALAGAIALGAVGLSGSAGAQVYGPMGYGPGWGMGDYGYGPGMMGGYGPGWGMMGLGQGMMYAPGYGRMGPGWYGRENLNLSTDDVRGYLERWIAIQGNPRLKVGDVKETNPGTIQADIVTKKDNAVVQRFDVDHHNGFYHPSSGS